MRRLSAAVASLGAWVVAAAALGSVNDAPREHADPPAMCEDLAVGTLRLGSKRLYSPLEEAAAAITGRRVEDSTTLGDAGACGRTVYVAAVTRHGARFPTEGKWAALAPFVDSVCGDQQARPMDDEEASWCAVTRAALLSNATYGDLAAEGGRELAELAREVARVFFDGAARLSEKVAWADARLVTTSKRRTVESCEAFVREAWPEVGPRSACDDRADDKLLRFHGLAPSDGDAFVPVEEEEESVVSARLVACQLDAVLRPSQARAPAPGRINGGGDGGDKAPLLLGWRWPCRGVLEEDPLARPMLAAEDAKAHRRARRAALAKPLLRAIAAGLDGIAADNDDDDDDGGAPPTTITTTTGRRHQGDDDVAHHHQKPRVDVFFGHDSTLAPLAGLLDLFADSRRLTARLFPFASRLIIHQRACGLIHIHYNGRTLRSFPDRAHFKAAFKSALAEKKPSQSTKLNTASSEDRIVPPGRGAHPVENEPRRAT